MEWSLNMGVELKKIREKAGLTQEVFGEMLGVSASTISNYERGLHGPSTSAWFKLETEFSITPSTFIQLETDADSWFPSVNMTPHQPIWLRFWNWRNTVAEALEQYKAQIGNGIARRLLRWSEHLLVGAVVSYWLRIAMMELGVRLGPASGAIDYSLLISVGLICLLGPFYFAHHIRFVLVYRNRPRR